MKFLIAATVMCLALVGQSRAGSLRGLTVPVPHQSYGVPVLDNEIHIEETQPIVADKDSVSVDLETHEEPIVSHEIETVPFVDTLPLIDSIASFGTPSQTYLPSATPTTPKPELPYLEPGLPTLPEAPFVPEVPKVSEEYVEVSNEYLPPVEEYVPSTDEAPLPPTTAEVLLPAIHEIPALPEAPATPTPTATVGHSGQYFYEPPAIGFPTPIGHIPELPATTFIGTPSEVYGPPAHEEHKISELFGAANVQVHIPELPAAPVTTFAAENARPSEIYELPEPSLPEVPAYIAPAVRDAKTVPVEATKQYFYEPPAVAFPTPESVQPIKTLPAAETPRQYFYDVPATAFPTPVTVPVAQGIVSHSGFLQNSASSSSSSSSLHVNKYAVPLTIQPHADAVVVEEITPIGPGFAIHSVTGSSENTSTGQFNQVSVVNHLLPHLPSFGTVVGLQQPVANSVPVPVPHAAYGVANF